MSFHKPLYSARLHGAIRTLKDRRAMARSESQRFEKDSQAAAMLRGKARAYDEAIELLRAIEQGHNLPRRLRWTRRTREGKP